MKALITGAGGQVGRELVELARARAWDVRAADRAALDVTDASAVQAAVTAFGPDVVINAAAYTAVDRAEEEREVAFAVNAEAPGHLARACQDAGTALVHVSTDYVFDGTLAREYREDDAPNPLGVYGASKWAGEEAVRAALDRHVIVRTSWVFGRYGSNFVKTMARLARERDELHVVADQHGRPTPADALAERLLLAAEAAAQDRLRGTLHVAGAPPTTWHGLAVATVAAARAMAAVRVQEVLPIATEDFPTPARRPPAAVLDTARSRAFFGLADPEWEAALHAVVEAALGAR